MIARATAALLNGSIGSAPARNHSMSERTMGLMLMTSAADQGRVAFHSRMRRLLPRSSSPPKAMVCREAEERSGACNARRRHGRYGVLKGSKAVNGHSPERPFFFQPPGCRAQDRATPTMIPWAARNGTPVKGRWGGSMSMSAAAKKYRWRTYTPSRLWAACKTSSWRGVGTFKPCCAVTLASNIGSSGWLGVSPGERRHGDGRSHGAPTFRARRP
jgi:hypothetical protein